MSSNRYMLPFEEANCLWPRVAGYGPEHVSVEITGSNAAPLEFGRR
jgi:hypothetical protein